MATQLLRVLVADDDHPYSILLKKTLMGRGHSVVTSGSGDEAIARLQKEKFDIVLLDYKMEDANGINILKWIRSKKIETPVILITGHGTSEVHEDTFKLGAAEHFIKGEMDTIHLPVLVERVFTKNQSQKTRLK